MGRYLRKADMLKIQAMNDDVPVVHLQGLGKYRAKRADEVQVGDVLVWNFGYTSLVTAIRPKGKQFLVFTTQLNGETYERPMKKDTLVGYQLRKAQS